MNSLHLGLTPWRWQQTTARSYADQAALAESWGYQSFWLPENHFNSARPIPDPLMILAAAAVTTEHIQLATTSLLLPVRHPMQIAEQVAVLDQLSNGRVLLGLGRGYQKPLYRAYQVSISKKRDIFAEHLQQIIAAWRGDTIVTLEDGAEVKLSPLPVQRPHPPLWMAAFGPKALAQTANLGLPYLASPLESLSTLQQNWRNLREINPNMPGTVPIMRTVYLTEDKTLARQLRDHIAQVKTPFNTDNQNWAIIGDQHEVTDTLAEYKQCLGLSHLIIGGLNLPRLSEQQWQQSLQQLITLEL